jgi:hypothetical protein
VEGAEPDFVEQETRAAATLAAVYLRSASFVQDRACAAELAREAGPIVDSLLRSFARGVPDDASDHEHHEALAMTVLLGRRAGALGVTPTAMLAIVPALGEALASVGAPLGGKLTAVLGALALEGYVAAREERLVEVAAATAADAQPILKLAPRCLALVLSGEHEPERVRDVVETFGRALFKADALACVVDLTGLRGPSPQLAAEVFAADVGARMLGALCVFCGASPAWLEAATSARVPLEVLTIEPSFEAALARALEVAGYSLKPEGRLRAFFKR